MILHRYINCLRLNARLAWLAARGRWLSREDVARGYDAVAPSYETEWLAQIRPVTDVLLDRLPDIPPGAIMDLGCGTGYTTARLAARYANRPIIAVDISEGMLAKARAIATDNTVEFVQGDMLENLQARETGDAALVFTAWAIGYSRPAAIIHESGRVLARDGIFAFVVNRMDTLGPVFRAFRRCMARFPNETRRALWPRFPRTAEELERAMRQAGLTTLWNDEGRIEIAPRAGMKRLDWLLRTGALAGFDAVLPLREGGPVADYFEGCLRADPEPICHHYVAAIARKG